MKNFVLSSEVLSEQTPKVSLQLALLTARMARFEWPEAWHALLDTLYTSMSCGDWTTSTNATQTFLQVLLALASKKLSSAKMQLREAAVAMLPALSQFWARASLQLLAPDLAQATVASCGDMDSVSASICSLTQHTCSCVKILQTLLMICTGSASSASAVQPLVTSLLQDLCAHMQAYCSALFQQDGGVSFVFEQGEFHAAGWASVKEWEGEDDSTDTCSARALLDCLDISATLQASPALQLACHSHGDTSSSSPPLRAALCLALCRAKVLLSLAVIPLHMHTSALTRASLAPCSLPLLQLYHSLLRAQYRDGAVTASCEPAAVAFTLFLSTSFSHADSAVDDLLATPTPAPGPAQPALHALMELLLTCLLRLSSSTLAAWSEEPEELDAAMQASSESDSLRSASEGLFASMLHHSPAQVAQLLVDITADRARQAACVQHLDSPMVSDELLFWDAVYVCCGLGSYHLSQCEHRAHFSSWLTEVVGGLLTTPFTPREGTPQVLHHRLLWLMSCWGYELEAGVLKQLFGVLVTYLDPARFDLMVRLQAVRTLSVLMQCDEFAADMILEVLEPLLSLTCQLVTSEVTEAGVQVFVINFFQEIVDSVGPACKPHLGTLVQHVMPLWGSGSGSGCVNAGHDCEEDEGGTDSPLCIVRTSLLELFTSFVLLDEGESGAALCSYIEGPLSYATSASDESAYLCQHGLTLWCALMQSSATLSPHMVEMFKTNLPRIFSADLVGADYTELRTTLSLIESYIIVGGLEFVASMGDTIAALLHLTVGQVRPRAAPHAVRPIEVVLLMACSSSSPRGVMDFLLAADVLTVVIRPCLAAMGSLCCNEDVVAVGTFSNIAAHFEEFQESDIALVSYLAVCARCLLLDAGLLASCCSRAMIRASGPASGGYDTENILLKGICRLLIEKFDTFGYSKGGIWRRRLSCCSLLCLYPSSDPTLLDWLPEVLYMCDDLLSEAASDEGREKIAALAGSIISVADDDDDDDCTGGGRSILVDTLDRYLAEDPALKYSMHAVLTEKLDAQKALVGEHVLQTQVYASMDITTLTRLLANSY